MLAGLRVASAGREYDKSGVLRPWWSAESIARFKQRAQCFDDQYSAYTAHGHNVRVHLVAWICRKLWGSGQGQSGQAIKLFQAPLKLVLPSIFIQVFHLP